MYVVYIAAVWVYPMHPTSSKARRSLFTTVRTLANTIMSMYLNNNFIRMTQRLTQVKLVVTRSQQR